MSKVLVVDDDRFLLDNLKKLLEREGHRVEAVSSGEEALSAMVREPSDLIVLDLGLPGIDGIATCRRLRGKWHTPVIMLTSRGDSIDKVIGLEVGADDYLTKPFEPSELLARVRAQLRRSHEYKADPEKADAMTIGGLTIDFEKRDVLVEGQAADLTNREFELIAYLAKNLNRAIARDQLFETVWGYDLDFNSNSLDVYIYRIRRRIEVDPAKPRYLQTMRGFGYMMVSPAA